MFKQKTLSFVAAICAALMLASCSAGNPLPPEPSQAQVQAEVDEVTPEPSPEQPEVDQVTPEAEQLEASQGRPEVNYTWLPNCYSGQNKNPGLLYYEEGAIPADPNRTIIGGDSNGFLVIQILLHNDEYEDYMLAHGETPFPYSCGFSQHISPENALTIISEEDINAAYASAYENNSRFQSTSVFPYPTPDEFNMHTFPHEVDAMFYRVVCCVGPDDRTVGGEEVDWK